MVKSEPRDRHTGTGIHSNAEDIFRNLRALDVIELLFIISYIYDNIYTDVEWWS